MFNWINRNARWVVAAVVLVALGLGVVGPMVADTSDPDFDPSGPVFEITARADSTLVSKSTTGSDVFLVEAPDGSSDVLTADALREWKAISDAVIADEDNARHLVSRYDHDIAAYVPAVFSIADVVDAGLPGGLAGATDADVKAFLSGLQADGSGILFSISEQAEVVDGVLVAPAFLAEVTYDRSTFAGSEARELWLRDVQTLMQSQASLTDPIGVAIDFDTTFNEAIEASAPFIFLAVALVVLLVAAVHRSYWSSVIVAAGLGATMLAYNGVASLVGLKMGSLLLAFVVPIAMISFGVDFYIHGAGRVREMQVEHGLSRRRAYPAGMKAVFTAMLLAVVSSVVAFLSNIVSGTEAIIEFGIGAAIALGLAYVILGLIAPRVLVGIESTVGPNPHKRWSRIGYALALLPVAVLGGLAVALAAVQPAIGAPAVAVQMLLVVALPVWLTRRRNRKAARRGRNLDTEVRGAAHGLETAGAIVRGVAARRAVTIPVLIAVAAVTLVGAFRVQSGFALTDFLGSNTDVIRSLDRFGEHYPSNGEGSSLIYIEGDLTDPATLAALDDAVAAIDESEAGFGHNTQGDLIIGTHAADVVRIAMANPQTAATLGLVDADGDGFPDESDQIAAVYEHVWEHGLVTAEDEVVFDAAGIPGIVASTDSGQATALRIQVASFTDGAVIMPVIDTLETVASDLEASTSGLTTVGVGGEVVSQYLSLESFRSSMLLSLPIAILLTLLVAAALLRSIRFAIAAVIPIGFVVAGVYAFMTLVDYRVNVVTATIAAIAVGVGIDFSTHFTARYMEELESRPTPLDALRTAGAGTGGALVLSALTSVLGFTVMAFAPTPIFSVFGILTAVMIALALLAATLVLPTVLLLMTPRRRIVEIPVDFDEEISLAA